MDRIYHLALRHEWADAERSGGPYRRSTLGRSLDDVGFVHCSFEDQVEPTGRAFYTGRDDVVRLTLDPTKLGAEVRVEGGFPHVYGPLPLDAVVAVDPVSF